MKKDYNDNSEAIEDTSYNVHDTIVSMLKHGSGKALDVGAGFGLLSRRLKDMGYSVTACDLDRKRLDHIRKFGIRADRIDLNSKLPYKSSEFELVVSSDVIEHLKSPYSFIEEAGRVTRKGGIIIISTPNIINWYSRMRFLIGGVYNNYFTEKEFQGEGYHISPLHFYQLRWMLEQAGFRILEIKANQYSGLINSSGLKILISSLIMLPMRLFMKPENRALIEGDILIIKAAKR